MKSGNETNKYHRQKITKKRSKREFTPSQTRAISPFHQQSTIHHKPSQFKPNQNNKSDSPQQLILIWHILESENHLLTTRRYHKTKNACFVFLESLFDLITKLTLG